jgi:hypothetical protein
MEDGNDHCPPPKKKKDRFFPLFFPTLPLDFFPLFHSNFFLAKTFDFFLESFELFFSLFAHEQPRNTKGMTAPRIYFNDLVSICYEKLNCRVMSAGVSDPTLRVPRSQLPSSNASTANTPPVTNFEQYVFSIQRVKRYNAMLSGQQQADTTEPVTFGSLVQLQHTFSGQLVTVARGRNREARAVKRVRLEPANNAGDQTEQTSAAPSSPTSAPSSNSAIFKVLPRYKIRQEGEAVSAGDHIALYNEYSKCYLFCDDDNEEIIAGAIHDAFSFAMFDSTVGKVPGLIRTMSALLLFHKELEAFVDLKGSGKQSPCLNHPPIRDSTYNIAHLNFSSNALWVLENVNPAEGGPVRGNPDVYRLKHAASSRYLAVSTAKKNSVEMIDDPSSDLTLWSLMPCDGLERDISSSSTYFRIFNPSSSMWLRTISVEDRSEQPIGGSSGVRSRRTSELGSSVDGKNKDGAQRNDAISCVNQRFDAAHYTGNMNTKTRIDNGSINGALSIDDRAAYVDVFCAVNVSYEVERNVHSVLGHKTILSRFQSLVEESKDLIEIVESPVCLSATATLEALIPFCTESEVSDVLKRDGHPIEKNQNIIIDQQLHLLALRIIRIFGSRTDLAEWNQLPDIEYIVTLLFSFLRLVTKENPRCCNELAPSLQLLAPFLGSCAASCGVFVEFSRLKKISPELSETVLSIVLPLLTVEKEDHYTSLLRDLCFSGGAPNVSTQRIVFARFRDSGLAPKILVINGEVHVSQRDLIAEPQPLTSLTGAAAKFCIGAWTLLGAATIGLEFRSDAWVQQEQLPALLAVSCDTPCMLQVFVTIARSVFLSEVTTERVSENSNLWLWKYKQDVPSPELSKTQQTIVDSTLSCLSSISSDASRMTSQIHLLNELLVLWNCIVLTGAYNAETHVEQLGEIIGNVFSFVEVPSAASSGCSATSQKMWPEKSRVMIRAAFHAANLLQTLLDHHALAVAKEMRTIIRPRLHDEGPSDGGFSVVDTVREKANHSVLCNLSWVEKLLLLAAFPNAPSASAFLACIFSILHPTRLAVDYLQSVIVFSEGHENEFSELLDLARELSTIRHRRITSKSQHMENLLQKMLRIVSALRADPTALADAQNILVFCDVHLALLQTIEFASYQDLKLSPEFMELSIELLEAMTRSNAAVAASLLRFLNTLITIAPQCSATNSFYGLMGSMFAAADETVDADASRIVSEALAAPDRLTVGMTELVLRIVGSNSAVISRSGRDAFVTSVGAMNFSAFDTEIHQCLLQCVVCSVTNENADLLCQFLSVEDLVSPPLTAAALSRSREVLENFETRLECLSKLYLRGGTCTLLPDETEAIANLTEHTLLDIATHNAGDLTAGELRFVHTLISMGAQYHPQFLATIYSFLGKILTYCETCVQQKFDNETRAELVALLEAGEHYVAPRQLPSSAVVRRRLQRTVVTREVVKSDGAVSSISLQWGKLQAELQEAFAVPSSDDLHPLTKLLVSFANDTMRSNKVLIEIIIRHLKHSVLPDWVNVGMLLCFRYLLEAEQPEKQLQQLQNLLNSVQATPLISTLLEKREYVVVRHAVKFGIAQLEGGNKNCQDTLLRYFRENDEKYFYTIRQYLKFAQHEIGTALPSSQPDAELSQESFALIARDLCRLLQLLCEGHHFEFQNYVRHQDDNFNSYNMCILLMELLHTVVTVIDPQNICIAVQCLNTLTEFCQGPCQLNQQAIVSCDVVTEVNRILTTKYDTNRFEEQSVLDMKCAAIITLLALLEGSQDATIPNLLLTSIDFSALHMLLQHVWRGKDNDESLLDLGFNICILGKILVSEGERTKADKLRVLLADTAGHEYFNSMICNIEIWRDDDPNHLRLETVYFRKPDISRLRKETKEAVHNGVDRSSLISKHSGFFRRADDLIFEMEYQFLIEQYTRGLSKWLNVFNLASCRPRPVEDLLLALGLLSNVLLILGWTTRSGPVDWISSTSFTVIALMEFACCVYLVLVRFILKLPLLYHQQSKRGKEFLEDPRGRWRDVADFPRIMQVLSDSYVLSFSFFGCASALGAIVSPFFQTFLLSLVTFKAPLLANIVRAITMNGRQLLLTAFLGVIAVYFFSVLGYLFFAEHFVSSGGEQNCATLLQCFFYSFGQGVRGGGGIGEDLITNSWESSTFFFREAYDTLFFVIVAVIVMNIVFALIVDTFAELRDARKKIEEDMRTTCFVCGIDAATFDREGEGFLPHTKGPHNVWQYLYFMHHLRRKEICEFTGQESYVYEKMLRMDLSFFPVGRSKSLIKAGRDGTAGGDEQGTIGTGGVSMEQIKQVVLMTIEDMQKKGHTASSGSNKATGQGAEGTPSRGSQLWARARDRKSAFVGKLNLVAAKGATSEPPLPAESQITLLPAIQEVADTRAMLAAMTRALNGGVSECEKAGTEVNAR